MEVMMREYHYTTTAMVCITIAEIHADFVLDGVHRALPDDLRSCSLPRALLLYSLGVLAGRLLQRDGELPQH